MLRQHLHELREDVFLSSCEDEKRGGTMMKKLSTILLTFLLAIGLLAGCNGANESNQQETDTPKEDVVNQEDEFPVTLKDGTGEEVVIEKKPKKIVSLMPSNTEIAFALGLGEEIVGVSDHDNYPEEAEEKEKIGGQEFNVEKIISLAPDLVLAHYSNAEGSKEGLQQLRDAGITVLVVHDAQTFDTVFETIDLIGKATGESDAAEKIIADMKETLEMVKDKVVDLEEDERKSVLVEVSPAPEIYTTGKNTFMDEMIQLVNAKNVAKAEEGWVQLSEETIIEMNPDVIVTTYGYYVDNTVEQVLSRKGWEDVTALKNEQVIDVNADLVNRSGPRLAKGVEELAKAIYPELFTE